MSPYKLRAVDLALTCSALASGGYSGDCSRMRVASEAVIFSPELKCPVAWRDGSLGDAKNPKAGRATRSLSLSLRAFWPLMDGKRRRRITSSSGLSRSSVFGTVLAKYVGPLVDETVCEGCISSLCLGDGEEVIRLF